MKLRTLLGEVASTSVLPGLRVGAEAAGDRCEAALEVRRDPVDVGEPDGAGRGRARGPLPAVVLELGRRLEGEEGARVRAGHERLLEARQLGVRLLRDGLRGRVLRLRDRRRRRL